VAAVLAGTFAAPAAQSLEPAATLDALLRLAAYTLVGLAAAVSLRDRSRLRQAALVLVTCGAFQAAYGSAEYLSGRQQIFGYVKRFYTDVATGTFVNRNHFAAFLAMTLPLAFGLVLDSAGSLRRATCWRERIVRLGEPGGLRVVVGLLAAPVIWIGIVLSHSRGGLAAAIVGTTYLALRGAGRRRRILVLSLLLALPTVALLGLEVLAPGERFVSGDAKPASLGGRLPVWRAALGSVGDFLPFGTGLGTFEAAFPLYRSPAVHKVWDHAHNDWLQALVEGGPLVPLALAFVLWLALRGTRACAHEARWIPASAAAGLVAIAVHSAVDFSLRIPANAVLCACLVGMSAAASAVPPPASVVPLRRQRA
jgi:O-antigen ligase